MSETLNNQISYNLPYIHFDGNVIADKKLKQLYNHAVRAISVLEIYELLNDLCHEQFKKEQNHPGIIITETIKKKYNNLFTVSKAIAKTIEGRVTITLPDGHVIIDTCKAEGNNYDNYVDDIISENHNTRTCIFQAQYVTAGVSYERKFSSTTHQKEVYIAIRLGPFRDSAGTFRISVPEC